MKFKVGDWVICKDNFTYKRFYGFVGKIIEIDNDKRVIRPPGYTVEVYENGKIATQVDNLLGYGSNCWFTEDELQPAENYIKKQKLQGVRK